jgi:hypothetical protein
MEAVSRVVQRLGPYLLLEIVMPGGSLMALGLYLYRRRREAAVGWRDPYGRSVK